MIQKNKVIITLCQKKFKTYRSINTKIYYTRFTEGETNTVKERK